MALVGLWASRRAKTMEGFALAERGLGYPQIMLELQAQGCHNVNLVTPTHYLPQILEALEAACGRGLTIPLVYNCGGYEELAALRLLDGLVDIYLPDVKYGDPETGLRLSWPGRLRPRRACR